MANELMLPPYLYPSRVELEKVEAIGMSRPMFGYAFTQRLDYGATYWRAKLTFEKLRTSERSELLAFLDRAGRKQAFLTPVYGEAMRGASSYFIELLNPSNQFFANSISGWINEGQLVLSESGRVLRGTVDTLPGVPKIILRNSTMTDVLATGAVDAPHVHRTLLLPGRNPTGFNSILLRQGYTTNGVQYGSSAASYGYFSNVFVPTTTTLACQLSDGGSATLVIGDYFETAFFSASRVGIIASSGQTGGALYTAGWPSSISNLLRAGDFANVQLPSQGLHLARLVAALHTTSGGLGYLQFEPILPTIPASGAAVIPYSPLLKAVAIEVPVVRTYPPGHVSDVELTVGEVP